jgi:hypothetical protein
MNGRNRMTQMMEIRVNATMMAVVEKFLCDVNLLERKAQKFLGNFQCQGISSKSQTLEH